MPISLFCKRTDAELHGPLTEKKAQAAYRELLLDESDVFYFTSNDEPPNLDDTGYTLKQLIDLNGYASPFENTSKGPGIMQRINYLNQKAESLQQKHDSIRKLQDRVNEINRQLDLLIGKENSTKEKSLEKGIQNIEAKLKTLSTEILPWEVVDKARIRSSAKSNTAEPSVPTDERKYAKYADLMIEVLTALEHQKYDRLSAIAKGMESAEKEIVSKEHKAEFLDTLLSKLKELDFSYCTPCDLLLQSAKHAVFHLIEPEMHLKIKGLNESCCVLSNLVIETSQEWINEEMRRFFDEHKKHPNMNHLSPSLVPRQEHVEKMTKIYIGKVFEGVDDKSGSSMRLVYPRLKSIAPAFKKDYEALLGKKTIRCFSCRHIIGNLESYYMHLTTYSHLSANDGQSYQDPASFFINYLMKNRD